MRKGKIINPEEAIYLLDKQKGHFSVPTYAGEPSSIKFVSLKYRNRRAFDNNMFKLVVGDYEMVLNSDEIREALKFV